MQSAGCSEDDRRIATGWPAGSLAVLASIASVVATGCISPGESSGAADVPLEDGLVDTTLVVDSTDSDQPTPVDSTTSLDSDGQDTATCDCDDGLACTSDFCVGGECRFAVGSEHCLDGGVCVAKGTKLGCSECNGNDDWGILAEGANCQAKPGECPARPPLCDDKGACIYDVLDCDDGLPCTTDSCGSFACEHTPTANACVVGGACVSTGMMTSPCETCVGGGVLELSEVGVPCASGLDCAGTCDASGACRACDDGLACTVDSCVDGACVNKVSVQNCVSGAGNCVPQGSPDPQQPCSVCGPNGDFVALGDGTPCPSDHACKGTMCLSGFCSITTSSLGCDIGGLCKLSGTLADFPLCQVCAPDVTDTSWSPWQDAFAGNDTAQLAAALNDSGATAGVVENALAAGSTEYFGLQAVGAGVPVTVSIDGAVTVCAAATCPDGATLSCSGSGSPTCCAAGGETLQLSATGCDLVDITLSVSNGGSGCASYQLTWSESP